MRNVGHRATNSSLIIPGDTTASGSRAARSSSNMRRMSPITSGPPKPSTIGPTPYCAARRTVSGFVHARNSGGWGSCTGRGTTVCGGRPGGCWIVSSSESHWMVSSRQQCPMNLSASSTWGVVSSGSTPHSDSSCAVPPRAAPRFSRPSEMMSSIAARSATRTGWLYPNGMHTAA